MVGFWIALVIAYGLSKRIKNVNGSSVVRNASRINPYMILFGLLLSVARLVRANRPVEIAALVALNATAVAMFVSFVRSRSRTLK
jgi:ABC-type methionine transport system permease subunit